MNDLPIYGVHIGMKSQAPDGRWFQLVRAVESLLPAQILMQHSPGAVMAWTGGNLDKIAGVNDNNFGIDHGSYFWMLIQGKTTCGDPLAADRALLERCFDLDCPKDK